MILTANTPDYQLSPEQHSLLESLRDASWSCVHTLSSAAAVVERDGLRSQLTERAAAWRECERALTALLGAEWKLGTSRTTTVGVLRLTWMKVKAAVGDTAAIFSECDFRETVARGRLVGALDSDLPEDIRRTLTEIQRRTASH